MSEADEEACCPLCLNELDETDEAVEFCRCGYAMCLWCWHRICGEAAKEGAAARCPNCRTIYDLDAIHQRSVSRWAPAVLALACRPACSFRACKTLFVCLPALRGPQAGIFCRFWGSQLFVCAARHCCSKHTQVEVLYKRAVCRHATSVRRARLEEVKKRKALQLERKKSSLPGVKGRKDLAVGAPP